MNKESAIISYTGRNDACFWYRNKIPLDALARKGWKTTNLNMGDMLDMKNVDCVQFSRVYTAKFEPLLYMLKEQGVKIWYDIDDAVDLVKPFNPFCGPNKEHMSAFYFLLNEADFITTTNENLKEHLSKKTPKPVNVFSNYINPAEWKERPKLATNLRVGFAGSASHIKEVNMILPVIAELQKHYDMTFVMFGMGEGGSPEGFRELSKKQYYSVWDTWEYTIEVEKMCNLLKDIKCEWNDPVRWEMYPRKLAKLDLDIGICPLVDDDFNRCKTSIKMYEYAMVGTTTLASNVTPFREEALAVTDNDFKSWYDALDALLMHYELRESTLASQRDYVIKNKMVDENIHKLEDILASYGS